MTATLVLHLGPHKTATTLLQETLVNAEGALDDDDVRYAITGRNGAAHHDLAFALWSPDRRDNLVSAGRTLPTWQDLADEVGGASDATRVVVSSENLAHVRDDEIAGARALADRSVDVELVVGVRRLDALLPSLWQEGVKWGRQWPFDEAVGPLLDEDRVRILPLLDRWAEATRPQAIHVVSMPAAPDAASLLESFAEVIGCGRATLAEAAPTGAVNASLSWLHVEALRSVSATLDPTSDASSLLHRQRVLHQLIPLVPPTDGTTLRPVVPSELYPALEEVRQEIESGLADRGVIVHGTLPSRMPAPSRDDVPGDPPSPGDVVRTLGWMQEHDLSDDARSAIEATRRRLRDESTGTRTRWRHRLTRRTP